MTDSRKEDKQSPTCTVQMFSYTNCHSSKISLLATLFPGLAKHLTTAATPLAKHTDKNTSVLPQFGRCTHMKHTISRETRLETRDIRFNTPFSHRRFPRHIPTVCRPRSVLPVPPVLAKLRSGGRVDQLPRRLSVESCRFNDRSRSDEATPECYSRQRRGHLGLRVYCRWS